MTPMTLEPVTVLKTMVTLWRWVWSTRRLQRLQYLLSVQIVNSVDNNCNGDIDEQPDGGGFIWYWDKDGDGFGRAADYVGMGWSMISTKIAWTTIS